MEMMTTRRRWSTTGRWRMCLSVIVRHAEDHVPRHERAHRLGEHRLVTHGGAHDVALGEDADRPALRVDDDERADVVLGEQRERLSDRLLRLHGDDLGPFPGEETRDGHGTLLLPAHAAARRRTRCYRRRRLAAAQSAASTP